MIHHRYQYVVICRHGCGIQPLDYEDYMEQLGAANSLWVCPKCGDTASWDDECLATNPVDDLQDGPPDQSPAPVSLVPAASSLVDEFEKAFRKEVQKTEIAPEGSFEAEDYEFDCEAAKVARERGLVVVFPEPNQLQIDLDSPEAAREFERRMESIRFEASSLGPAIDFEVQESRSGVGHQHVTLTFKDHVFEEWERIALQAALGDDPIRVYLNAKRKIFGQDRVSRLFEKPKPAANETPTT